VVAALGTDRHCHGLGAWCGVFLFDHAGWMIVRRRAADKRQRCDEPPQEFATAAHHQDPLLKTKISRIGEPAMLNTFPDGRPIRSRSTKAQESGRGV
jgi:hypothetical protein